MNSIFCYIISYKPSNIFRNIIQMLVKFIVAVPAKFHCYTILNPCNYQILKIFLDICCRHFLFCSNKINQKLSSINYLKPKWTACSCTITIAIIRVFYCNLAWCSPRYIHHCCKINEVYFCVKWRYSTCNKISKLWN